MQESFEIVYVLHFSFKIIYKIYFALLHSNTSFVHVLFFYIFLFNCNAY